MKQYEVPSGLCYVLEGDKGEAFLCVDVSKMGNGMCVVLADLNKIKLAHVEAGGVGKAVYVPK